MACLVAGFGCYTLAGTSADQAFSIITLTTRYAEICQLTTAIHYIEVHAAANMWKFQPAGHGEAISTKGGGNGVSEKLNMSEQLNNVASETLSGKPRKWQSEGTPGVIIKAMKSLWEGEEKYPKFQEYVDEVAQLIEHVADAVSNARGAAVLARGRQASLDVNVLTVCLNHMTSILHELRTLQAIHTSIRIDKLQIEQSQKERDDQIRGNVKAWNDLIKTLKGEFGGEIEYSMKLAFQMLQMALVKEGSEPIQFEIDTNLTPKSMKTHEDPKGLKCREAVARESIQEILKFSKQVQSSVWSSGILLFDKARFDNDHSP